jgi:hypothetical protein
MIFYPFGCRHPAKAGTIKLTDAVKLILHRNQLEAFSP